MDLLPGFVALTLGKGRYCVIPEHLYVAGLRLGKTLRRGEERRESGGAFRSG